VQWFNKTHDRVGHLFQGRFKGTLVEKETELLNVIRYVALNAVDAGIVERPEDDRWGSYRAHAGYEAAPEWLTSNQLLGHFAPDRRIAQQLYRTFIADGIGKDHDIWPRVVGQIYLGRRCGVASSPGCQTWSRVCPGRCAESANSRRSEFCVAPPGGDLPSSRFGSQEKIRPRFQHSVSKHFQLIQLPFRVAVHPAQTQVHELGPRASLVCRSRRKEPGVPSRSGRAADTPGKSGE
jgi:hypothetical protein